VKRIDVVHRGNEWVGKTGGRAVVKAPTKDGAVHAAARKARADAAPVSVKIHKLNGEFQEERTYPRSADPRRSPG
jgi:hypothetical protein